MMTFEIQWLSLTVDPISGYLIKKDGVPLVKQVSVGLNSLGDCWIQIDTILLTWQVRIVYNSTGNWEVQKDNAYVIKA